MRRNSQGYNVLDNVRSDHIVQVISGDPGNSAPGVKEAVKVTALQSTPISGTVTKSLASSGGDFATFQEFYDWLTSNIFASAEVTLNIAAETFNIPDVEYVFDSQGISKLTFKGANQANSKFNCLREDIPFIFRNGHIRFDTMTFVAATAGYTYELQFDNCYVVFNDVTMTDFYQMVWGNGSDFVFIDSTFTEGGDYGGYLIALNYCSSARFYNTSVTGTAGSGRLVTLREQSKASLNSGSALNTSAEGIHVEEGSQAVDESTHTSVTAAANITVNEIQYDGRYVSNNTGALSFKA